MWVKLTAVIEKEDNMFIALCPELDIASQGETREEAKSNLVEAVELFYEYASENEIEKRL
jgi:predicted RNase H-like HicB family nuclease